MFLRKISIICTFILLLICSTELYASSNSNEYQLTFCRSVENFKPVEDGAQFETRYVSILLKSKDSFGAPSIMFSIYAINNEAESLIQRKNLDISPTWNVLSLSNVDFEKNGIYKVDFTTIDGKLIATNNLTIKISEKKSGSDNADKIQIKTNIVSGTTLADIYNKYSEKSSEK